MSTYIYWLIFIGFTIVAFQQFKQAVIFYLAIKVVLIKPILLFYLEGFPLVTLDRAMELVLIIYLFIPRNKGWAQFVNFHKNQFFLPWTLLIITQVLLLIGHASTGFINASKGLSLFVFEYFLFYVLIVDALKHQKELKQLLLSLGLVFLLAGIYGLITKWTGENPFIDFFALKAREIGNENLVFIYGDKPRFGISGRVQSVVFHAIAYGGILALFIPVFISQFLQSDKVSVKFLWYALVCILVVNLILANSRAALVSCVIIGLSSFYFLAKKKRTTQNTVMLIAPLILAFGVLVLHPKTGQYFNEAIHGFNNAGELQGSTFVDRNGKFQYAMDAISDDLVFGKGFGHVAELIKKNDAGIGGAESFWLRQLVEAGFVGVLGYIFFFTWICIIVTKQFIATRQFDYIFILSLTFGYFVFISLTGELNTFPFYILLLAVFSNLAVSYNPQHE